MRIKILSVSWQSKKLFPSACKEISQTNGRLRVIQVVEALVDTHEVVAEIVSVTVVVAVVVDSSSMEDMVVTVLLPTPIVLLFVLLCLLKDVVLPSIMFLIFS